MQNLYRHRDSERLRNKPSQVSKWQSHDSNPGHTDSKVLNFFYHLSFRCKKLCLRGDLQDGGGVRRGDHLPPHNYIRNTSTCGTWGLLSASNLFLVFCLSQFSIQSLISLVDLFIDLDALFLFFLYVHIYILSVQFCFNHLPQGSVGPFFFITF